MQLRIKGSFESFYKNNKEIFDESFAEITPQTVMNWRNGKNIISIVSICKAIKSFESLSQKEEEFFQILYFKRIIWKIYKDMEEKNKEQLKHFVVILFKIIFIFSSLIENTDEEKKEKFLEVITEELNIQNKEKKLFLENFEKMKILDKNLENSKLDFEKIITNSINRIKFNNNVYKFNDKYNVLKEDYSLDKHKKLLKELENKVQLKNYYEYNYYIYFLVDSYNLLNIEKEKYKNQELRDSTRFLEQLEKKWKGKLNNKIIEGEYKKTFNGEIRAIAEIFKTILEISPNLNLMIEIMLKEFLLMKN